MLLRARAVAIALASPGPMAFQLRLIEVSVLFSSRALARAVAPLGPIVLELRLIEVRVVFLVLRQSLWRLGCLCNFLPDQSR